MEYAVGFGYHVAVAETIPQEDVVLIAVARFHAACLVVGIIGVGEGTDFVYGSPGSVLTVGGEDVALVTEDTLLAVVFVDFNVLEVFVGNAYFYLCSLHCVGDQFLGKGA